MKINFRIYTIITIITGLLVSSCSKEVSLSAADKAFSNAKYFTAVELYKKSTGQAGTREKKAEVMFKIAESYRMMNNTKQSEIWYDKAIKGGYTEPIAVYQYADALKANEKFDLAIEQFEEYLRLKPNDSLGTKGLEASRLFQKWQAKPINFEVANESGLNTKESEFSPAYYGEALIFTSTREPVKGKNLYEWTGKGYVNLYVSSLNTRNKWNKPEPLTKDINTAFNEGVASFDPANQILYYTQCNGSKGKTEGCRIFWTSKQGEAWSEPQEVMIDNDSLTVGNPSISQDGKTLYFVSSMPGGFGGNDIWYVTKQGDSWTKPVNLGPKINTAGNEDFPFIHPGGTLYFASTGHMGLGGLDLFYSDFEEGNFTDPINLKYPANSSADDFGLILDEKKEQGYFSSNRIGGKGDDDIYSAIAIPLEFTISGRAINAQTNKILPETKISLIGSDGEQQNAMTDKAGVYKFKLKQNVNYDLAATKKRFFGDQGSASTMGFKESTDLELNFKLIPIPLKEIVITGIYYDLDKADLRPESMVILDSLIRTLNDNPTFVIELASHTDSRADSAYNQALSQRRAQSVVDYLTSKGIDSLRLQPKGYGESQLVNECKDGVECTEEQHQANRRTSFRVISEDYVPKVKPKVPPSTKPKAPGTQAKPAGTQAPSQPKPNPAGTQPKAPGTSVQQSSGQPKTTTAAPAGTTSGGTATAPKTGGTTPASEPKQSTTPAQPGPGTSTSPADKK